MTLAPAAAAGFHNASAYDAHRPAYPASAVQALLTHMGLADKAHARVVEVAAGTGKFTEALAARHEGFEVVAVEPHAEMRRALEAKGLRGVRVRAGRAEELRAALADVDGEEGEEEEDGRAWTTDGVVVAQAWHWFAGEAALQEVGGVLRPGGVLGLVWNIDDYNKPKAWSASTTWAQHLNDWLHSLGVNDGSKRFRDMEWQTVFYDRMPLQTTTTTMTTNSPPLFSVPLGQDSVAWTHWLSEDALWRRINTLSHVALLEGADRERGEEVFRAAMRMADVRRNEAGEVECHGRTYLAWTNRM